MPFLPRQSEAIAPSAWGQAIRDAELAQPQTSTVIEAFAQEATVGVGTGYADIQALKAEAAGGRKLNKEEMTAYEGVPWYDGITDEAAQIQKEFNDKAQARAKIISEASTGQAIAGFLAGFGAGIVEPKNAAIGLGVSVAAGPLGAAGYLGNRARMAYQLAKTSTRARVAIGAGEGLVAAALTEPSNRYSAKVLQQDYTMMDSAFNVLTSTAFGAAVPAVSGLIKTKVEKFKGRTMDVVAAEVDLATQQLELGQRVDVSAVEAAQVGKLADAPVERQVEAVKTFTRYTETPEFKARVKGSKVVDADGKPLMVYRGSYVEPPRVYGNRARDSIGGENEVAFSSSPSNADTYTGSGGFGARMDGDAPNIAPYYLTLKNPLIVDAKGNEFNDVINPIRGDDVKHYEGYEKPSGALGIAQLSAFAKDNGYDGLIIRNVIDQGTDSISAGRPTLIKEISDTYITFSPDQIIPAFGDKFLSDIVAQSDAANTATITQHNTQAIDPRNDTVIDYDAVDALDERRAIMEAESEAEAEMYFQQAEAEIRQMLDEGTLNDADLAEYRKILEEMKDSKKTTDALETLKLCLTGL